MSGHSKWKTIKHKKAATDAKRANIFTKLANVITIAAKEKGIDPEMNPSLRSAISKAKAANMPNDNIDRAVKRGSGDSDEKLETIMYEGYGPEKSAILIETITNNRNRTSQELKNLLSKNGGNFASEGSVLWMFDKVGKIVIKNEDISNMEEFELSAIDAGAEDVVEEVEETYILTKPDELFSVTKKLEDSNTKIEDSGFDFIPKTPLEIEDETKKAKVERVLNLIDENDDVQEIYTNVNF
jgi:YebC/PmpR family DNA-binding regulatory protein